jgi:hypothetical protein
MNRQNSKLIEQAKQAAFKDVPWIFISLDGTTMNIMCKGREHELAFGLKTAMANSKQLSGIISKAQSDVVQINQTITL